MTLTFFISPFLWKPLIAVPGSFTVFFDRSHHRPAVEVSAAIRSSFCSFVIAFIFAMYSSRFFSSASSAFNRSSSHFSKAAFHSFSFVFSSSSHFFLVGLLW